MKTARIIISPKCNRSCHYCCNEQPQTMPSAVPLRNLEQLFEFDAVVLTGGEPMLFPDKVISLAKQIKAQRDVPVFMYSATFTKYTQAVLDFIDGITYSMHEEATVKDAYLLQQMQELASFHKFHNSPKQFWLSVHDDCEAELKLIPKVWDRIKFFHHLDVCPVPENETLFILDMEV